LDSIPLFTLFGCERQVFLGREQQFVTHSKMSAQNRTLFIWYDSELSLRSWNALWRFISAYQITIWCTDKIHIIISPTRAINTYQDAIFGW